MQLPNPSNLNKIRGFELGKFHRANTRMQESNNQRLLKLSGPLLTVIQNGPYFFYVISRLNIV